MTIDRKAVNTARVDGEMIFVPWNGHPKRAKSFDVVVDGEVVWWCKSLEEAQRIAQMERDA